MAILFVILAGLFVALSNLCMRKSVDGGGTTKGFLVFQMALGFLVNFFIGPVALSEYAPPIEVLALGAVTGIVLATMLFCLGRAVENGPPGFTFSIIASATVMPGILMALFFGAEQGYPYTAWHAVGSLVVLAGLFWGGKGMEGLKDKKRWILFSFGMFCLHAVLLSLFQWRSLLIAQRGAIFQNSWFVPAMFLVACVIELAIFLSSEKRRPQAMEMAYGALGGTANAACTYFIVKAAEVALPLENAIIFPIYSVISIILSNLWSQRLYQEKINWKACQVCAIGLLVAMVDWKTVLAFIF
ncbi:MAG: hypothetical protein HY069_00145 [Chlamydiia bacterium]|nr:hypothetical protein [Chlamydiia bacterium]